MHVKQAPREAPDSECWGPSFGPLRKANKFRRDPKVDPLRIESGPSWRACFGPFILSDVLKFCKLLCAQNVKLEATDTNSIRGRLLNWEARICVSNFSYLLGPKNRPLRSDSRSKSHPNDHLLDSWAGTSARDSPTSPLPPQNKI